MGDQTSTTEQTTERKIAPPKEDENKAIQMLLQMAQDAQGQLGQGGFQLEGPTSADRQIINESIGSSADIARTEMEKSINDIMAQLDENLTARGMQGSTVEAFKKGQVGSQGLQEIAKLLQAKQEQGGQALLNLPMQRAGIEGQMNQQLYQRLIGGASPVMQAGLSERLNAAPTFSSGTQVTPFNPVQLIGMGAQVGQL
jgi:hypothetical protein